MAKDLVLLKFSGSNGVRLAALCRPSEGMEVLRSIVGDDPDGADWVVAPEKSMVAIATEGLVTITDAEDLTMLSFWLATAANWLKQHGG